MPLSPPSCPRTLQHTRTVVYHGYQREDGLWDIEGELQDVKPIATRNLRTGGMRPAGTPIHHMSLRVTVNDQLVVQAIEASMDSVPVAECPQAVAALQKMVGCSMGAAGARRSSTTLVAWPAARTCVSCCSTLPRPRSRPSPRALPPPTPTSRRAFSTNA